MHRATLIVQNFSYNYVANFVHYLHGILRRHLDADAELVLCEAIDEAEYRPGTVFIIGENFPPFTRRPGCTYALINLSVVTRLGSPFSAGLSGHRQILRKSRMLASKLPLCDILLDYYPPQTKVLRRRLGRPVFGFDFAVAPSGERDREPLYDVCFVGGMTERRAEVLAALEDWDIILSPTSGAPIEEVAAASRLCLNIHTERSNHLEIPRLVAALSNGCPVVTETSFGLADFAAGPYVIERRIGGLVDAIEDLLGNSDRLAALGKEAADWYAGTYLPRAERRWEEICRAVASVEAVAV